MRPRLPFALPLLLLVVFAVAPRSGQAQLAEETATRRVADVSRAHVAPAERRAALDLSSFKGRYAYEVEGFRQLIPLAGPFRRCVEAQRPLSGEFHTRLDFLIEPSGKLQSFAIRNTALEQLHACLVPQTLGLRFPAFRGSPSFTLQVIVASPGVQLGRRTEARAVGVYPVGSEAERRAYALAGMWVASPWSMAIDRCAELVDQTLGFGYRVSLLIDIAPSGRPKSLVVELRGKLAGKAIDSLVSCALPFVKALELPPHSGREPFPYRKGTSTAGWGSR